MGARKRNAAKARKEAQKSVYFAKLRNEPSSPRKMRLVVDMIRGMEVGRAALANWEQKNERKAEAGELYVSRVFVDCGPTLKRMRPAPQGRGYRIRKRSNHVTLFVDTKSTDKAEN